jgi:hypothetical protein
LGARYGKHKQKEYSVFIGEVSNEERKTWQPQLDVKEVTECKWISLTALDDMLSGGLAPAAEGGQTDTSAEATTTTHKQQ